MKFIADLHIHSKYSRATAKNLDFENLYIAAQIKGITVVGTGDFTHPAWFSEIKDKLLPAEPGLFRLKDEYAKICDRQVPPSLRRPVRFILESEISNIYKKDGKTRKNHNLIFVPNLEIAENINSRLDNIGNIKSDGRPILGLDAKHLLEIMLDVSEESFLIPAHIWTPWFSLLGSKSGFDSIEACFEDLTEHIFAVETGLSSDPAMNWRVSNLDNLTLVSNSDAHSPMKLGREANLFNTELSYDAIKSALKENNGKTFLGTYEFYPEEGKYHLDGHRKCGVRFLPKESIKHNGNCPVCNKPLTLGVLYRVEELADREEKNIPDKNHSVFSIIPLEDILSELIGCGPKTKKVQHYYHLAVQKLGSEFDILHNVPIEKIKKINIPLLGPAIEKMRQNKIHLLAGFDGEFGQIQIFTQEEKEKLLGQKSLFKITPQASSKDKNTAEVTSKENNTKLEKKKINQTKKIAELKDLNPNQSAAIKHKGNPLLIVAGPGTGKTLTITHKIAYLIKEREILPHNILAVTFTNKAAQEMRERISLLLDNPKAMPLVATFHALCFKILKDLKNKSNYTIIDEIDKNYLIKEAVNQVKKDTICDFPGHDRFIEMIIAAKQNILDVHDDLGTIAAEYDCDENLFRKIYETYQNFLSIQGVYDFQDLIFKVVTLFEKDDTIRKKYQDIFKYIFVDEYQDLNNGQYRIIKALTHENKEICVIGDPDQSIYGFRGSDVRYFKDFIHDFPDAEVINLTKNYRSTETILEASYHVIKDQHVNISGSRVYSDIDGKKTIEIMNFPTEKAEAVAIGKIIENMVGGIGFYSIDFGKTHGSNDSGEKGFSDFAILYRTSAQGHVFADQFEKAGIPFQMVSKERTFSRKGILELLSLIKITSHYGSYIDLERVIDIMGTGIGKKTFEVFKTWCFKNNFTLNEALVNVRRFPVKDMNNASQLKLDAFITHILDLQEQMIQMNIEQKLIYLKTNIKKIEGIIAEEKNAQSAFSKLISIASIYQNNVSDFFGTIALQEDVDTYEFKDEKVALMTMHSAKGLEFPIVFIVGCEKDLIPFKKNEKMIQDIDEEKRLFYVAMTRAKEHLYLTYVNKRRIYGKVESREMSPFVNDIENELRTHTAHENTQQKKEKKSKQIQLELF